MFSLQASGQIQRQALVFTVLVLLLSVTIDCRGKRQERLDVRRSGVYLVFLPETCHTNGVIIDSLSITTKCSWRQCNMTAILANETALDGRYSWKHVVSSNYF